MIPENDNTKSAMNAETAARELLENAMTLIELKNAKTKGRELNHIAIKAMDAWKLLYHEIAVKVHSQQSHDQTIASLERALKSVERVKAQFADDALIQSRCDNLSYYIRWLIENYGATWSEKMFPMLRK